MNYLEYIFNSVIAPSHEPGFPTDPVYQELNLKYTNSANALYKTLTPDQKDLFYAYMRYHEAASNMEDATLFSYAFRLGSRFMCEVLQQPY